MHCGRYQQAHRMGEVAVKRRGSALTIVGTCSKSGGVCLELADRAPTTNAFLITQRRAAHSRKVILQMLTSYQHVSNDLFDIIKSCATRTVQVVSVPITSTHCSPPALHRRTKPTSPSSAPLHYQRPANGRSLSLEYVSS